MWRGLVPVLKARLGLKWKKTTKNGRTSKNKIKSAYDLLIHEMGDELRSRNARRLVIAFETTFKLKQQSFQHQLANVGKLK